MNRLFLIALLLIGTGMVFADDPYSEVPHNVPFLDDSELPPGWPDENPFNILASMNCWTKPALDHTGKPHHHGHVAQLIVDGDNNVQDLPREDGMPGGDDSLAVGNFNMVRLLGTDGLSDPNGQTGMFYSQRYFIPLYANKVYYMRLWEGNDVKTAPYYQDTIEYATNDDQGGTMIRLRGGLPMEVNWVFGPSKPRPGGAEAKADGKEKKK